MIEKRALKRTEFLDITSLKIPIPNFGAACLVHLVRNRYSVLASFANRPVSLRVYPGRIVVAAEGQIIWEHRRIINRSHDGLRHAVHDWRHHLAVLQRKPGALRNGAPFVELPDAFKWLQQYLLKHPDGKAGQHSGD